jgi:hypothetical protein
VKQETTMKQAVNRAAVLCACFMLVLPYYHYIPEDRILQEIIKFSGTLSSRNVFTLFHHADATNQVFSKNL